MTLDTTKQKCLTWRANFAYAPLIAAGVLGAVFGFALWQLKPAPATDSQTDQISALTERVTLLEERVAQSLAPRPAQESVSPPRGAQRPAARAIPPAVPAKPVAPSTAASSWGTTDLDREIAAFPQSNTSEQDK